MGIETAALAVSAIGAMSSASAARKRSAADKAAYEYQAQVAQNNAQMDEWQAEDAIRRGQVSEGVQRLKTAQLKGNQRATLAARGIDLGEGSALNILTSTDVMGEQDALTIRNNAAREAWGYRARGQNDLANAGLLGARADQENPGLAASQSLLGSAGQVADSWYRYKTTTTG